MRRRFGLDVVALVVAGTILSAQQSTPPLQRIVEFPHPVQVVDYCSVPSLVAGLARKLMVPAGVEYLPGRCHTGNEPREMDVEVDVLGVTVEVALDRLVAADPRYRWRESEGVILLRPLTSWSDPSNWLNQSLTSLHLLDSDLPTALLTLACRIPEARCARDVRGITSVSPTEQGSRRFSVALSATSVIGALNAIVVSHGTSWWEARDHAGNTSGADHRMLWLHTPDGSGLGVTTKTYR